MPANFRACVAPLRSSRRPRSRRRWWRDELEGLMQRQPIVPDRCIVRNTAARKGRTQAVAPETSATRFLHYGRIILDAGQQTLRFDNRDSETGLICLKGSAVVQTAGKSLQLDRFDAVYIPRDSTIDVAPGPDGCDL